jgi:hypothetical protein
MICRDKVIFSCLIAAGLGAAGGYIFSSKFCAVTIVNRVGQALSSNQNLIHLFNEQAFSTSSLLRSVFFNLPDTQAQADHLSTNQNRIIETLHSFYGNTITNNLRSLFERNKDLIIQMATQAREKLQLNQTTDELRKNNDQISKTINDLNTKNHHISMNEIPFLITQQIIALQNNNWKNAIDYLEQTRNSYEKAAEQINGAIATQFPQKI